MLSRSLGRTGVPGWASEPSHWASSKTAAGEERRRPQRGASDEPATSHRPTDVPINYRIGELLFEVGRLPLVALFTALQGLMLLLQPIELARRLREAPDRARAAARRVKMASRDPETTPGRLWDWFRLSAHFVREELADMQDGFPQPDELLRESLAELKRVSGRVARPVSKPLAEGEALADRIFHSVALGLIAGAVVVGLFVAGFQGIEALKESDLLAIEQVRIVGTDRVGRDEIVAALGIGVGDNLLEIEPDLEEARLLPWIAELEVDRDLRDQVLEVRVVEHVPALLLASRPLRLVDDRGVVFKKLAGDDPFDMPLLTVQGSDLDVGDPATQREASQLGLEALHALEAGQVLRSSDISEIRYEGERGVVLITRTGLPVHLGRKDFATRLGRLERAVQQGSLPLDAIASVDLGLRDRLVVVPRYERSAQRAVRQQVEKQPISEAYRDRMLHLRRVHTAKNSDLFVEGER